MNKLSGFNFIHDILPLGKFETIPVVSQKPPYPKNYPEVVQLPMSVNAVFLRKDFLNFKKKGDYFKSRARFFKNDFRLTVKVFEEIGFYRKVYQAYPLRKIGTNILLKEVNLYTKSFLESFGVKLFRQQYVVAKKGWNTKLHIDHPNFKIHGYRLFIPIDSAFIGFEDNIYCLEPGKCYFINIAKKHRGFTLHEERVVIMAQMSSDELIIKGEKLNPIDSLSIPKEFQNVPV